MQILQIPPYLLVDFINLINTLQNIASNKTSWIFKFWVVVELLCDLRLFNEIGRKNAYTENTVVKSLIQS